MSYCELKIIDKKGDVIGYKEYRNAHGGCAFIWDGIYDRYLKDPNKQYDSWLSNSDKLWPLYKDKNIEEWIRIVLASTYDTAMIKRKNLIAMADYYARFVCNFSRPDNICHLDDWARDIIQITKEYPDCIGVCFYGMSVSEDPWWVYETSNNDDEGRPYNINVDTGHCFIFEEVRKIEECNPT